MAENEICSCACGCSDFKDRPFEFNVHRVRGLNEPFTRSGIVFGNILHMIDSVIGIVTFERIGSNLHSEWVNRDLENFFQYHKYGGDKSKFEIERFKFKIYWIGNVSKPFTRSGRVLGDILEFIDSMIGIVTFGYFDSSLSLELSLRNLSKLGRYYVGRLGVESL
jgi:hypothetical protein